jgi:hypothetical protein
MGLVEFIGFIVSLFFLLVLFTRPFREARKQKKDPQKYAALQKRQEQQLRKIYTALGIEGEEEKSPPKETPLKKAEASKKHNKRLVLPSTSSLPSYLSYGKIEEQKSAAARILAKQRNRKELIIIQEILNRPLGLDP